MRIFVFLAALGIGSLCLDSARALEADRLIVVTFDHATLLNLPPHSRSIVIGNPAIVHVTPLADAAAVLTGMAFGETNVLVLDEAGHVLMEASVLVIPQADAGPYLLRGLESTAYSCGSRCEVTHDLQHNSPETEAVQAESQTRNANISAVPQPQPSSAAPQGHGSL
jgi:Flp pilus assembly secretin CpaC